MEFRLPAPLRSDASDLRQSLSGGRPTPRDSFSGGRPTPRDGQEGSEELGAAVLATLVASQVREVTVPQRAKNFAGYQ